MPPVQHRRFIEAIDLSSESVQEVHPSFAGTYCCRLDYTGETLVYEEPDRWTDMRVALTQGYVIDANSISQWRTNDGRTLAIGDDERLEVVRRVIRYAALVQGVLMTVRV